MEEAAMAVSSMTSDVGAARQIREYDGDRRKRSLALVAATFLEAGETGTAADTKARASDVYLTELRKLAKESRAAEVTLAEYEAAKLRFESARSVLSLAKTLAAQL
jgi:hypothetical protein